VSVFGDALQTVLGLYLSYAEC